MGEELELCGACARHVRVSASACPFCGRARVASAPRELVIEPLGLSRAALVALGASLALAGCPSPGSGGNSGTSIVNPYGAPVRPEPPDVVAPLGPTTVIAQPYGAPMPPPLPSVVLPPVQPYGAPIPPPPPPPPPPDAELPLPPSPMAVQPYGAPPRPRVVPPVVHPYGAPPPRPAYGGPPRRPGEGLDDL